MGETRRESVSSNGTFDESQLLECLFDSSECGIAILDDQLRYVRINNALAEMNGVAVEFHIGKTVREVLGNAATEIEGQLKRVFSKGVRVDNFHLVAKLPTRKEDAHWNESYLPMKDRNGAVKHVCVIVTELGEGTRDSAYYRKPTPLTRQADEPALSSLTDRELQILQYLATGKSNKEAAVALCISVKTVETYRSRIMLKLDAHSMSDLIHFAIRHKVVEV